MTYGYARVSSRGQQKDGNSLEAQEKALRERGCAEVRVEAYTGMTVDRPVFSALLDELRAGDTLMVTKLDRFSRTAADGARLVQELHGRGIIIEILNMGRADNTPMGRLMVNMLLAFAEFDHDMTLERFNEGKSVARSHGKRTDGRKPIEIPDFQKYFQKKKDGLMTVKEICAELGISRTTWYELERRAA